VCKSKRSSCGFCVLIGLVALAGAGALAAGLLGLAGRIGWPQVLILPGAVALHVVAVDLFTYDPKASPTRPASERRILTMGLAGIFLALGRFGLPEAVLVAFLQAVLMFVLNRTTWYKQLFNTGLFTVSAYVASLVYEAAGGLRSTWDLAGVGAAMAAVTIFMGMQSLLVALVISISTGRPLRRLLLDSAGWVAAQQAVVGVVGLLLGHLMQEGLTFAGGVLLFSPLILLRASYKSFAERTQTYVMQVKRANGELAEVNAELKATNDELIQTLGSVLDARDRYTFGHSARVALYSVAIGERLSMPEDRLDRLRRAALLHDIGKVGIPEAILAKHGPLDAHERLIMQAHAEIGYRITSQVHSLASVAEIVRQHHEWIDGGGYPRRLKGDAILLEARIIGVADAFDTLTSDRPYRKARPVEAALRELHRCAGTQFDPAVVGALEAVLQEHGEVWVAQLTQPVSQAAMAEELAASVMGHMGL